MTDPTIRQLRSGEEPRYLRLLDGWPFSDGRLGSAFFRKYLDDDCRYKPANVWVAEDRGELVSCVQIFPRDMWLGSASAGASAGASAREAGGAAAGSSAGQVGEEPVSVGGIGSVFTAQSHRRRGLAEQLLHAAAQDMTDRGMVLSLLSATRVGWYSRFGWQPYPGETVWMSLPQDRSALALSTFQIDRDLRDVRGLHREYLQNRPGTLSRSADDWTSSLRTAGNPDEDFWVAHRDQGLVAYLRGTRLGNHWVATEWARARHAETDLAELFVGAMAGTGGSPISSPRLDDGPLSSALEAAGIEHRSEPDPSDWSEDPKRPVWMLRELASEARSTEAGPHRLNRFDPSTFCFWPSDRF